MDNESSFRAENEIEQSISVEVRQDGDLIVLTGNDEQLAEIGRSVCNKLNRGFSGIDNVTRSLLNGEVLRPGGAYAIWLKNSKLYVDARNARGSPTAQKEIIDAVNSSL